MGRAGLEDERGENRVLSLMGKRIVGLEKRKGDQRLGIGD